MMVYYKEEDADVIVFDACVLTPIFLFSNCTQFILFLKYIEEQETMLRNIVTHQ